MLVRRVTVGQRRREVRCAQLQSAARPENTMKFLHHPEGLVKVLDHVLHHDVIEALAIKRIWEFVEVVDDVSVGILGNIDPDRTRCLGRSAADLALSLSTIAGPDSNTPLAINESGDVFARPLDRSFKGVRVAWFKDLGGVPFDPRVRSIMDAHRATFESLGCIAEQAEPDFSPAEISFRTLRAWTAAANYGKMLQQHPNAFKDTLRDEIQRGTKLTGQDIAHAEVAHSLVWRNFQSFLGKYEYFILPTTQTPPFDVNKPYPAEIAGVHFDNYIDWMKSCWYISATGNPAASVPAGFTPEGLPVGLQIVGRDKLDFSVLQMAHAFEQATGFGTKHPAIA